MRKVSFLTISILLHLVYIGYSQSPSWQWAFGFGGQYSDLSNCIIRDNSGNLIVTGQFKDAVDFDPGPNDFTMYANNTDAFILKVDSSMNFIWAIKLGSTDTDIGINLISDDSSNLYITGIFKGTVDFDPGPGVFTMNSPSRATFILKLDNNGAFQWAKSIHSNTTGIVEVNRIRRDENCNLYLGGYFSDTTDFDPGTNTFLFECDGSDRVFILKLDNQGEFNWVKVLGSPLSTYSFTKLQDMDVNKAGEIVLTGYFQYELDLNPGLDTLLFDAQNGQDAYICKLDSSGNFQWGFTYGTNDAILGNAITFDSSNNVIASGTFRNSFDANPGSAVNTLSTIFPYANYLIKFDNSGNVIWNQSIDNAEALGITYDAQNNLYVSGIFTDTSDFDPDPNQSYTLHANGTSDIFIFKSDSNGYLKWVAKAGGQGWDRTKKVVLGSNDDIYLTGWYIGASANFGMFSIQNASTAPGYYVDCYVARLYNLQTGINETPLISLLNIYPNPAFSAINVMINQSAEIIICDMLGKELLSKKISSVGVTQVEFEISSLASGIYIIKAGNMGRTFVKM